MQSCHFITGLGQRLMEGALTYNSSNMNSLWDMRIMWMWKSCGVVDEIEEVLTPTQYLKQVCWDKVIAQEKCRRRETNHKNHATTISYPIHNGI